MEFQQHHLFVIVMEYLTRLLKGLNAQPKFKYHPKCAKLKLMQLGFADDLLLFCRGNMNSVTKLFDCYSRFSQVSGLQSNSSKSTVYFGGVKSDVQHQIL